MELAMKPYFVSVLLFCFAMAAGAQVAPRDLPLAAVLSTSGQGEAKVSPDRVSVMVNVQTRGSTAAAAGQDNAKRTQAVFDAMLRIGIPKDQLATEGYNVYPEMQYSRDGGTPKVTGYVATNTIRVESKRVEQAG